MPTECPDGLWLSFGAEKLIPHLVIKEWQLAFRFFLQKEKANDGESVISFETHKKKVISIYSYNLDYDLY